MLSAAEAGLDFGCKTAGARVVLPQASLLIEKCGDPRMVTAKNKAGAEVSFRAR